MSYGEKDHGGTVRGFAKQPEGLSLEDKASEAIGKALDEFAEKGYITARPINVGDVDSVIEKHAKEIGEPLNNKSMYFTNDALEHTDRDFKKELGKAVGREKLMSFPKDKYSMNIYYDTKTKRYTYANSDSKFVLQPNQRVRLKNGKEAVVSLVTASKIESMEEFNMANYIKLK